MNCRRIFVQFSVPKSILTKSNITTGTWEKSYGLRIYSVHPDSRGRVGGTISKTCASHKALVVEFLKYWLAT